MNFPRGFKKILECNPVALATSSPYGVPHCIAAAYVKLRNGKIVITDNYMRASVANILRNPSVSLAVWDGKWAGYRVDGAAEYSRAGEWLDFAKRLKENKGEPCKGVIVVSPASIKKLA